MTKKLTKKAPGRIDLITDLGFDGAKREDSPADFENADAKDPVVATKIKAESCLSNIGPCELKVITRALEVYARLSMAQIDIIGTLAAESQIPVSDSISPEAHHAAIASFRNVADAMPRILGHTGADIGIFSDNVSCDGKLAWDLYRFFSDPEAFDEFLASNELTY
jgi:hypothetical protein